MPSRDTKVGWAALRALQNLALMDATNLPARGTYRQLEQKAARMLSSWGDRVVAPFAGEGVGPPVDESAGVAPQHANRTVGACYAWLCGTTNGSTRVRYSACRLSLRCSVSSTSVPICACMDTPEI